MMYDACESLVNQFHGQVDFEEFRFEVFRTLFIEPGFTAKEYVRLFRA